MIGLCLDRPASRLRASIRSRAARKAADGIGPSCSGRMAAFAAAGPDLQRVDAPPVKLARPGYRKRCGIKALGASANWWRHRGTILDWTRFRKRDFHGLLI